MIAPTKNIKAAVTRLFPVPAILHSLLGAARWLFGFFLLSEADLIEAGISVGSKRQDRSIK